MDIEKTIEFLLERQAKFDAWFASFRTGMEKLRQNQQATGALSMHSPRPARRRSSYTAFSCTAWTGGWKPMSSAFRRFLDALTPSFAAGKATATSPDRAAQPPDSVIFEVLVDKRLDH